MYKQLLHQTDPDVGENVHGRPRSSIWSRLRAQLWRRSTPDKIERTLSSRRGQFPDIRTLLAWYHRIAQTQQVVLLRESLYVSTDDGSICKLVEDETISRCFERILETLDCASACGLRICVLSAVTTGTEKLYSFPYEAYLTLFGKVENATRLFHLLAAGLLIAYWTATPFEDQAIEHLISKPAPEDPLWLPDLPSHRGQLRMKPLTAREAVQRPLEVDAGTWPDFFYLEWQWLGDVPPYSNDVDVYVWEPFKDRPPRDYIRLVALGQTKFNERKIVAIASSSKLLARLAMQPMRPDRKTVAMPGVDAQIFRLVTSIYQVIRSDVMYFLTQATARVADIDMQSRSNPSGWKIHLLLHLQECHIQTAQQCDAAVETVQMLTACIHLPCEAKDAALYEHLEDLRECRSDLEYIAAQLRAKADAITPLKKLVREQMDLVHNYRNTVIAVLVALYVPISFVSSFLGMNITDRSTGHYWRNVTSVDLSANVTQRAAQSGDYIAGFIASNQPNPKTWSLTSFWASAFPLAFGTIVIPILAGPTFRQLAQFAKRHRTWWRVVVMFLILGIVLASNLVGLVGSEVLAMKASQYWDHYQDEDKLWKESDTFFMVQVAFTFAEFGILFLLCCWHFLWRTHASSSMARTFVLDASILSECSELLPSMGPAKQKPGNILV
ncbi:hypothetical protein LTR36_006052 [Oleoguttula mirabilis]|uniref:Uncharacterized protein n=1 Tax=Oleoguttula mirabilis TaxID=1507867 RepID=A0AAV9JCP0_9PEZI|nr:hypothetical protein LTR36_006052 [Oleoguttula mirabilis]